MTMNKPYGTVLIKADQILKYLSLSTEPQRLHQIAKDTELTKSTASKILNTLNLIGYVQKNPDTQEFTLGRALVNYANKAVSQLEIKRIAQPYLEELQRMTTETVHLGILDKSCIVYITKIESNHPVNLYSQVGKTIPLYCSAMGKSILAELTDVEIEQYLAENILIPKTENTFTIKESFRNELKNIRNLGYAFDDGEHEIDVFCAGTSITVNGKNFGAISVSIPKYRITQNILKDIIDALQKCKAGILAELN